MRLMWMAVLALACLSPAWGTLAEDAPPARTFDTMIAALKPTEIVTYKKVGDRELKLHIFRPEGTDASDKLPVYAVIHGGGWRSNNATRFYPYAASLVDKGFVGISVEYRLADRDPSKAGATTVFDCVKDARAAIRYIRKHAKELGIDPERIAVGGGSAGAHLAFGCAAFDDYDHPDEDPAVSCMPDALVLLFGVLDTSPAGYGNGFVGEDWRTICPTWQARQRKRVLPPTILFHGDKDRVAPLPILERFCKALKSNRVPYKLVLEKDGVHGHINNNMQLFDDAAEQTHAFLTEVAFTEKNSRLNRQLRAGPALLAKGEDYTLHGFFGSVTHEHGHRRLIRSGATLMHTDRQTGRAHVMLSTGTIELSTRRISYEHTRLVGLYQTDTYLVAMVYRLRIYDAPPKTFEADKGEYVLYFTKKTGSRFTQLEAPPAGDGQRVKIKRPKEVPGETFGEGVILPTDEGFKVLGLDYLVREDGSIGYDVPTKE